MKGIVAIVALALVEYSVLGAMVGRARQKFGVPAPATTGSPEFERYFRVHQNTLEALIVFIPALLIFSFYVNRPVGIALGVLFLIARAVYANGYIKAPEKRGPGALMTLVINAILLIGGLIGLLIRAL